MITREEALKSEPLVAPNGYYNKVYKKSEYTAIINLIFDQQDQLQQHIKLLEAQLANTEQLTCESCLHSKDENSNHTSVVCILDSDDMPFEDGTLRLKVGRTFCCKYHQPKDTQ